MKHKKKSPETPPKPNLIPKDKEDEMGEDSSSLIPKRSVAGAKPKMQKHLGKSALGAKKKSKKLKAPKAKKLKPRI